MRNDNTRIRLSPLYMRARGEKLNPIWTALVLLYTRGEETARAVMTSRYTVEEKYSPSPKIRSSGFGGRLGWGCIATHPEESTAYEHYRRHRSRSPATEYPHLNPPHFKEQKWGRKNADSWPLLVLLGWWALDYGRAGIPPAGIQAYRLTKPTHAGARIYRKKYTLNKTCPIFVFRKWGRKTCWGF